MKNDNHKNCKCINMILEKIYQIESISFSGYTEPLISIKDVRKVIESNMDEIHKCEECSRRKWYQKGFNDGFEAEIEKWIPVSSGELPPENEDVFITYVDKNDKNNRHIAITQYREIRFGTISVGKQWFPPFEYFNKCYEIIAWMPMIDEYKGE